MNTSTLLTDKNPRRTYKHYISLLESYDVEDGLEIVSVYESFDGDICEWLIKNCYTKEEYDVGDIWYSKYTTAKDLSDLKTKVK